MKKPRYLIIIGPSGSGKSTLSNQIMNDFPDKFYYNDIDKCLKNKATLKECFDFMENEYINIQNKKADKNKIIIANSYSDKMFINLNKDDYIKIYIDEKYENKERKKILLSYLFKGENAHYITEWNTLYNPQEDFLYDRTNYEELKVSLLNIL